MLGYEKFIGMFLRFNILLDNFKGKRSGFLGRLNIHETDTERKCVSFFGSRTEMGRRSGSLSARFNTFSDVRVRTQERYQKDQFDMSLIFQLAVLRMVKHSYRESVLFFCSKLAHAK
jgi:hypothetical protein